MIDQIRALNTARTDVERMETALRAVMELHRPTRDYGGTACAECEQLYPCLTVQELDATLGLEGDDDEHLG